jgi:hypothetical protein
MVLWHQSNLYETYAGAAVFVQSTVARSPGCKTADLTATFDNGSWERARPVAEGRRTRRWSSEQQAAR